MTRADVAIAPEGTIDLFHVLSRRAERWVDDNVDPNAQRFGGALVVEHRFATDLAHGMVADGLRVQSLRPAVVL